jgi:hypothetical protein
MPTDEGIPTDEGVVALLDAPIVRAAGITLGITGIIAIIVPMVRSLEVIQEEELTAQTATAVAPASMLVMVGATATIVAVAGTRTMAVSGGASIVVQASTRTPADRTIAKIVPRVSTSPMERGITVMAALTTGIHTPDGAGVIIARTAKVATTTRQAAITVLGINIPGMASVTIVQGANLLTRVRHIA